MSGMLSDLMLGVQGSVGPRVGQDRVDATGVVQGTGAVPQQSHLAGSTTAPQAMPHVIETASTVGLGVRASLRGSLGGIGLLGSTPEGNRHSRQPKAAFPQVLKPPDPVVSPADFPTPSPSRPCI